MHPGDPRREQRAVRRVPPLSQRRCRRLCRGGSLCRPILGPAIPNAIGRAASHSRRVRRRSSGAQQRGIPQGSWVLLCAVGAWKNVGRCAYVAALSGKGTAVLGSNRSCLRPGPDCLVLAPALTDPPFGEVSIAGAAAVPGSNGSSLLGGSDCRAHAATSETPCPFGLFMTRPLVCVRFALSGCVHACGEAFCPA